MRRALALLPLLLTGCISYSVGTTARPVAKGEFEPNLLVYWVPRGIETYDEQGNVQDSLAYASADFEGRWGLSDVSDLGLRVPSGSGAIVNYKRLINGPNDPKRWAVAAMGGAGIVNFGNHFFFEGNLIATGPEGTHVPYAGARFMHVLPLESGAVHDTPTVGVYGGMRFRVGTRFSMSPELGLYHDKSALGLRKRDLLIIPALGFHWD